MTERLHRVHALLRASNVPCTLTHRPGAGIVLGAGTPNPGPWEVELHDTSGALWLHQDGRTVRLPGDLADETVANAVKLGVVQAWAEQGDSEARAVLARLARTTGPSAYEPPASDWQERPMTAVMSVFDPFELAAGMVDAAFRIGWEMFAGRLPIQATFAMPSPWGTVSGTFVRR